MSEQFILKDVKTDGNRMNSKKFVHKSMGFSSLFNNMNSDSDSIKKKHK